MRERGRYQIQCMKSRSSTGVGQKIDLEYNIDTMRITDAGEMSDDSKPKSSIYDSIKRKTQVESETETSPVQANVQSTKLKNMLATLKTNS
jgi:hypothetical protein